MKRLFTCRRHAVCGRSILIHTEGIAGIDFPGIVTCLLFKLKCILTRRERRPCAVLSIKAYFDSRCNSLISSINIVVSAKCCVGSFSIQHHAIARGRKVKWAIRSRNFKVIGRQIRSGTHVILVHYRSTVLTVVGIDSPDLPCAVPAYVSSNASSPWLTG